MRGHDNCTADQQVGERVAGMLPGILDFVLDTGTAREVVRRIMAAVPSGSVLTRPTADAEVGGQGDIAATRFWNAHATPPITARTRAEIAGLFEGLDPLEPGLVPCSQWRTGADSPAPVPQFGTVAVKP